MRASHAWRWPAVALAGALLAAPLGADTAIIERLATCQDSWLDWKDNPVKMQPLADTFNASFKEKDRKWIPTSKVLVAGLPVVQAFPENVGMGVGFSVIVDAPFERARAGVEKIIGKPFKKCDSGEGMRTCELELAPKRTVTLLAPEAGSKAPNQTLVGCYYYYEK